MRSSGAAEDLAGASSAGQYETVLGVRGPEAVAAAIGRCLVSASSERVRAYAGRSSSTNPTLRKLSTQQLEDGTPVHSFSTLLETLKTIARNRVVPRGLPDSAAFDKVTTPTPLQARALALLNLAPSAT